MAKFEESHPASYDQQRAAAVKALRECDAWVAFTVKNGDMEAFMGAPPGIGTIELLLCARLGLLKIASEGRREGE